MISKTTIILNKVKLGKNPKIGDFCLLGEVPMSENRINKTIIGKNALVRSHTIIYGGNNIGNNFQTGHGVLIREDNLIGDNVSIGSHTIIEHHVKIGNNVRIHSNSFIPEYSILEDDCWIGPNVTFTNTLHPKCPKAKDCIKGPIIRQGAKIGGGTVLLPGVIIGKNSLIGAGSVIVSNIPDNSVAVGNPAKVIKKINKLTCPFNLVIKPY